MPTIERGDTDYTGRSLRDEVLIESALPWETGIGVDQTDRPDGISNAGEEDLYDEIPLGEGLSEEGEEPEKVKMAFSDKVCLVLASTGMGASIWKIFPSPEGSPVKPYDGIIFFGGIALVAMAGGWSLYSNRGTKTPPSTYEDETW